MKWLQYWTHSEQTLNILWTHSEHTLNTPWTHPEHTLNKKTLSFHEDETCQVNMESLGHAYRLEICRVNFLAIFKSACSAQKFLKSWFEVYSFLCPVWQYQPQSHCTMSHQEASLLRSACYKLSCGRMRIQIIFTTSIHIVDQVPDAVFKLPSVLLISYWIQFLI